MIDMFEIIGTVFNHIYKPLRYTPSLLYYFLILLYYFTTSYLTKKNNWPINLSSEPCSVPNSNYKMISRAALRLYTPPTTDAVLQNFKTEVGFLPPLYHSIRVRYPSRDGEEETWVQIIASRVQHTNSFLT
jgi:hypothetical protein